jgi:dihydroorotate dehydrogenase electron transfer subunit
MRQTLAHCQRIELVGQRVRAQFACDLVPAPGQFLLARLAPAYDPYLRQTLFPVLISDSGFAVELSTDDPALRVLAPGISVDVIGPAGVPVPDLPPRSRLLLLANHAPAVLLPFASRAINGGGAATLLLAHPYPLDALDPEIELRVGDLAALTAEFAPGADAVLIHADKTLYPTLFDSLTAARAFFPADYSRALLRPPMPCGVGACGACAVKTARGHKLACADGPFFPLQTGLTF